MGTAEANPADRPAWWESRWLAAALIVLAAVPLLYPPIPPLVDMFGHMGRYRVELDLAASPWLQVYYGYHWAAIGNLGVDLLVKLLGPLIGLEPAVKLIVVLISPLTVAGFLWVAREVHGGLDVIEERRVAVIVILPGLSVLTVVAQPTDCQRQVRIVSRHRAAVTESSEDLEGVEAEAAGVT